MAEFTQAELDSFWRHIWVSTSFSISVFFVCILLAWAFEQALTNVRTHFNRTINALMSPLRMQLYFANFTSAVLTTCIFAYHVSVKSNANSTLSIVSVVLDCIFLLHFLLRMLQEDNVFELFLTYRSFWAITSLCATFYARYYGIWCIPTYFRGVEVYYSVKKFIHYVNPSFSGDVFVLIVKGFTLIYLAACTILLLEMLGDPSFIDNYNPASWNLFNSMWYIFVTMSTVGYGDMYANTVFGRLFILIVMILGIILFSDGTSSLIERSKQFKQGSGRFINLYQNPFVILLGSLQVGVVEDFLLELYNEERLDDRRDDRRVVLMTSSFENKAGAKISDFFQNHEFYSKIVTALAGQTRNENDTDRCDMSNAECVFIMSAADEHVSGDKVNIVRSMIVKQRYPHVTTSLLLNSFDLSRPFLTAAAVEPEYILYQDQLRLGMMALNCIAPGFSTLCYNLVSSRSSKAVQAKMEKGYPKWYQEYLDGADKEMSVVLMNPRYSGLPFNQAVSEVYLLNHVILFGLVRDGETILNPDTTVRGDDYGLVIARNDEEAVHAGTPSHVEPLRSQIQEQAVNFTKRKKEREWEYASHEAGDDDVKIPGLYRSRTNIKLPTADPRQLKGHIVIVIQNTTSLQHFIRPIRLHDRRMRKADPSHVNKMIVLLGPKSALVPGSLRMLTPLELQNVCVIEGDPMQIPVLKQARLTRADKIVILSPRNHSSSSDHAEHIFVLLKIKRFMAESLKLSPDKSHFSRIQIISEGTHSSHGSGMMQLMRASNEASRQIQSIDDELSNKHSAVFRREQERMTSMLDTLAFAAGEVYLERLGHLITVNNFFHPTFMGVIKAFLNIETMEEPSQLNEGSSAQVFHFPIQLLPDFIGESFDNLFRFWVEDHRCIPIGLFRCHFDGCCQLAQEVDKDDAAPWSKYVYTAPSSRAGVLCKNDWVYIVSQTQPRLGLMEHLQEALKKKKKGAKDVGETIMREKAEREAYKERLEAELASELAADGLTEELKTIEENAEQFEQEHLHEVANDAVLGKFTPQLGEFLQEEQKREKALKAVTSAPMLSNIATKSIASLLPAIQTANEAADVKTEAKSVVPNEEHLNNDVKKVSSISTAPKTQISDDVGKQTRTLRSVSRGVMHAQALIRGQKERKEHVENMLKLLKTATEDDDDDPEDTISFVRAETVSGIQIHVADDEQKHLSSDQPTHTTAKTTSGPATAVAAAVELKRKQRQSSDASMLNPVHNMMVEAAKHQQDLADAAAASEEMQDRVRVKKRLDTVKQELLLMKLAEHICEQPDNITRSTSVPSTVATNE